MAKCKMLLRVAVLLGLFTLIGCESLPIKLPAEAATSGASAAHVATE